jgi:hypothetical protein
MLINRALNNGDTPMTTEADVIVPVLKVLEESLLGELTTTEIREEVKRRITLSERDLRPLRNRPDVTIDQIIRNVKSHKMVPGNPVHDGLLEDIPRGLRITHLGRSFLGTSAQRPNTR